MADESPVQTTTLKSPRLWQRIRKSMQGSREMSFAWDTIKRLFAFVLVALAAFGLNYVVVILEQHNAPTFITYILTAVEIMALIADVVWFVAGLFGQVEASLKEIFRSKVSVILSFILVFLLGAGLSPKLRIWFLASIEWLRAHLA